MSRPKPTVLLQHSNKSTFKMDEVLAAEGRLQEAIGILQGALASMQSGGSFGAAQGSGGTCGAWVLGELQLQLGLKMRLLIEVRFGATGGRVGEERGGGKEGPLIPFPHPGEAWGCRMCGVLRNRHPACMRRYGARLTTARVVCA